MLGRVAWRWVANATPLVFEAPVAVAVVLLAVPATIVARGADQTGSRPAHRVSTVRTVPTCDNCARDEPELLAVRRVYVVPASWDDPGSETVVDEVEQWCVSCCTQYPHQRAG